MADDSPHNALAVFIPAQEGKSTLCARRLPEWILDRERDAQIAIVSYQSDIAIRWGREIKRDIGLAEGKLRITIRQDSAAAQRWDTPDGGSVYCVGVGGPLTGRSVGRLLVIDDPVKDRAEAESATVRESTWDWYESVALTRLGPRSRVVLIMCMTGDTPVLMGDGTEKPLRDVRPGDTIATYENGRVTTATVRNWANQGSDSVFRIRMKSGRTVRANARHPFLTIEDGEEVWRRTASLRPGSIILRVTGGSGATSPARAASPHDAQAATARGYVSPATTSSDGLMGTVPRQPTRKRSEPPVFATTTASAPPTTTGCSQSRAVPALSAARLQAKDDPSRITSNSASITTMTPDEYAACCATVATSLSDTREPQTSCSRLLSTYATEADEVAEIVPCGTEDVYDLQIDRTENFIANGLVAHNTRFHEDDLAGRILSRPGPLRWRVLKIPAIAEDGDELGRLPGEELESVRGRAPGYFRNLRAGMSPYVFSGMYQQNPVAPEGNFFRRSAFRYWRRAEPWNDGRERISCEGKLVTMADCWTFGTVDVAASTRTSADYTVVSAWAVSVEGDLILLDRARARVDQHDHFRLADPLIRRWGLGVLYVERGFFASTLVRDARDAGYPVAELRADTDKITRAIPAAGRVHAGRVWFPAEAPWLDEWTDELAAFPNGAHDDQVDTLSYAALVVTNQWTKAPSPERPGLSPHERAIAAAYASATGNAGNGHNSGSGGELDIMNLDW